MVSKIFQKVSLDQPSEETYNFMMNIANEFPTAASHLVKGIFEGKWSREKESIAIDMIHKIEEEHADILLPILAYTHAETTQGWVNELTGTFMKRCQNRFPEETKRVLKDVILLDTQLNYHGRTDLFERLQKLGGNLNEDEMTKFTKLYKNEHKLLEPIISHDVRGRF